MELLTNMKEDNNNTKLVLGKVFVFKLEDNFLSQISVGFETIEDANKFIETMKDGGYYKTIRPDIILVAMEIKNFR